MLSDRVDAVRRSTAEQLVMAARVDLDRCPSRLYHSFPDSACRLQSGLSSLGVTTVVSSEHATAGSEEQRQQQQRRWLDTSQESDLESTVEVNASGNNIITATATVSSSDVAQDADLHHGNGDPSSRGNFAERSSSLPRPSQGVEPPLTIGATVRKTLAPLAQEDVAQVDALAVEEVGGSNGSDEAAAARGSCPQPGISAIGVPGGEKTGGRGIPAKGERRWGGGMFGSGSGGGGGGGKGPVDEAAKEPLDRAGSCGLWLRLVMVPLLRECLDGSYRSRLLALHMIQVCLCARLRVCLCLCLCIWVS